MNNKIISVFFTAIVFSIIPLEAKADWIPIGGNQDFDLYKYSPEFKKDGTHIKMWELWNYKKPQGKSPDTRLSEKLLEEYDCSKNQFRVLSLIFYKGQIGQGEVVLQNTTPHEWKPIVPDTISSVLISEACKN